ncbi:MAG: Pycsar system effector family protein [Candidatus Hodarchaeota archaeon]
MEDKLWKVFLNVNKWLEYAEKKNTLILSFIGIQLTFVRLFIDKINVLQLIAMSFLGLCFLITLISFFPKTVIPWWVYTWAQSKKEPNVNDNLLFYGHITKYSVKSYIENLEKYFGETISGHKYLEDLCNQIVVNSQITTTKYNMFKATTWLMIVGQVLLFLSFWM